MFLQTDTLILGGGGVKSVAYLGALEEMIRQGLDWDSFCASIKHLAGSSAGSFSAACIGFGLSIEKLNFVLSQFDASVLFAPSVLETLVHGVSTVFKFPEFGMISYDRLWDLYKRVFRLMDVSENMTLAEYTRVTGKTLDVYVTNLSTKSLEVWNATTQPSMPVTFALTVSSCIPFVITAPVVAGYVYGDGGIMSNIPMTVAYDPAKSLVMMLDLEPRGELMQSVPSWFGHHLSRILDTVYEGHRLPHKQYDGLWEWKTIKLHTDSITLMDTFSTTKIPREKLEAAKRDGAKSFLGWLSERVLVTSWVRQGVASTIQCL
jgi:predicted acylesterase/phospholipase RssA